MSITEFLRDYVSTPISPAAVRACREHGWIAESSHRTSLGTVIYQRCADCGVRRVDLRPIGALVPEAVSHEVPTLSP